VRPLAVGALLLLLSSPSAAASVDRVAAVVNGRPVTATEVAREERFVAATGLSPVDPQIVGGEVDVLSEMILALLLRQRAEAVGILVEAAEVDGAIAKVAANNRMTPPELEARLRDDNGTWERFRDRLADRILQPRLLDREVFSGTIITEAEAAAEYAARREEFLSPTEVRISHLLLPLPADADAERVAVAESRVMAAKERFASGTALADLVPGIVVEGGIGGDLGWFRRGELQGALETAAFHLPAGTVAGPVRTPAGVHLLVVTERKEERITPFAEAKGPLLAEIHRRKVEAALRSYLGKLKAEAIIRFPK
jgi:peptidyl-prolyl cis-trans isomerase SurA